MSASWFSFRILDSTTPPANMGDVVPLAAPLYAFFVPDLVVFGALPSSTRPRSAGCDVLGLCLACSGLSVLVHFFLGIDNGFLDLIFNAHGDLKCILLASSDIAAMWFRRVGEWYKSAQS